jgi:subtilase family serine protease
MRPSPSSLWSSSLLIVFLLFSLCSMWAQQPVVQPRITQAVDEAQLTTLRGNTHPLALAKFDRGAAPSSLPLERMLLVLKRSPDQDSALLRLLDGQQDKSSPNYHKWLTPEEFGKRFGPADADVQAVTSWLQTHGFQVAKVSKGRSVVEFSGTAAMVDEAFHTQIHRYLVNGDPHWANASDPQIPSALTPVVAGVWTMHDFVKKPMLRMSNEHFPLSHQPGSEKPFATAPDGTHFLAPGDFAVIYGLNPVYKAGINGNRVNIAVVARSDFNGTDLSSFENIFGLPSSPVVFTQDGPDPGNLGGGEEAEAVLDATWSSALAPGAVIQFVVSASTDTTDGADLSAVYIVDNDLGDVMTESFGICEPNVTSTQLAGFSAVSEQAAAQGITYLVATGDTGSSGCDNLNETVATGPIAVSALASTAFNTAVGGTIFNENGNDSVYWSSNTNTPITALKYIPENVWNESCTAAACGGNANIAAGGGGVSTAVPKPSWQAGANLNIPNDGFRDLPDVSLTAALHDPYLICFEGSCSQGFLAGIAGTSASTPSFAGIMALVNQKVGGRVGLANYVLYQLAAGQAQYPAECSTISPNSACIFNDVTGGNNAVPGPNPPGQYTAAAGFDLATGLGSVNANNLVNGWAAATFNSTQTTLTLNPLTITHGAKVTVDIGVTAGSGTPTGIVSLLANASSPPSGGKAVDRFALNGGLVSSTTQSLPGGSNTITAHYPGNGTYAASDSPPVQVTVNAEPSTTTVSVLTVDSTGKPIPFTTGSYGSFVYPRADVVGKSGIGTPAGTVNFTDANGFVFASPYTLNIEGNAAPPNGVFTFALGPHAISSAFSPADQSFQTSTSNTVPFTITQAVSTTAVTAAGATQGVTITATVNTASGGNPPTGSFVFNVNGSSTTVPAVLEIPAVVAPGAPFVTTGAQASATFNASTLTAGQTYTANVTYSGDSNYTGSSGSASGTVQADFVMALSVDPVTVQVPGSSGTTALTVTAQNGFSGSVTPSCSGLPTESTCIFNPPTVAGNGTITVTIKTMAATAGLNAPRSLPLWMASGGLGVFAMFFGGLTKRHARTKIVLAMVLFSVAASVSCGGGSSGSSTPPPNPGTPVGQYLVTLTASSGSITHSTRFTLQVQ